MAERKKVDSTNCEGSVTLKPLFSATRVHIAMTPLDNCLAVSVKAEHMHTL